MPRKTRKTPEELALLIRKTARDLADEHGPSAVSAREIAKRIGYSAGTLYNVYRNVDDILIHVQADLLDELGQALRTKAKSIAESSPQEQTRKLCETFISFANQNRNAWLLISAPLESGTELPGWLMERQERALEPIREAVKETAEQDQSSSVPVAGRRKSKANARSQKSLVSKDTSHRVGENLSAVFATLFGLANLAAADRLIGFTGDDAVNIADTIVTAVLGVRHSS